MAGLDQLRRGHPGATVRHTPAIWCVLEEPDNVALLVPHGASADAVPKALAISAPHILEPVGVDPVLFLLTGTVRGQAPLGSAQELAGDASCVRRVQIDDLKYLTTALQLSQADGVCELIVSKVMFRNRSWGTVSRGRCLCGQDP